MRGGGNKWLETSIHEAHLICKILSLLTIRRSDQFTDTVRFATWPYTALSPNFNLENSLLQRFRFKTPHPAPILPYRSWYTFCKYMQSRAKKKKCAAHRCFVQDFDWVRASNIVFS